MKKFFLLLTAVLAGSALNAKTVLTEIPGKMGIPTDGVVSAWGWYQANLASGHQEVNGTDSIWVSDYNYADASSFDFIVMTLEECTTGYKFIACSSDWKSQPSVEFSAGTTLAAISLKEESFAALANNMAALAVQVTSDGVFKIKEIAYVDSTEYAAMKAADDDKERYMEKAGATDWIVNMDDNDASSWMTPGWFGDADLNKLYKNVVVDIKETSAISRICIQTLPNYIIHEYFLAPVTSPVKIVFPLTADENGIGQIAVCNRNITKFNVDSITGLLKEWTDPMTATINKIYYTSKEDSSTFTAVEEPKAYWIKFDSTMVSGAIAAQYNSPLEDFYLTTTDTNSKMSIDKNSAKFGTELASDGVTDTISSNAVEFSYRLKTGGKSSSSNALTLNIPADGVITIAVRTGSSSATDRKMLIKQNDEELFNDVITEGMKVTDGTGAVSAYPMIAMKVKKGTVDVTYPTNGMYFYAFGFGYDYYVKKVVEPEPEPEPEPEAQPGDEITVWEGSVVAPGNWASADLLSDGNPELIAKGMAVGDVVRFYVTVTNNDTLCAQIAGAHWEKEMVNGKEEAIKMANVWAAPGTADHFDMDITAKTDSILRIKGGYGGGCKIISFKETTVTKITLIKAATGINDVPAARKEDNITYNLAGQRAAGKGLLIKNGRVILVK